jgi:hypothetical protein
VGAQFSGSIDIDSPRLGQLSRGGDNMKELREKLVIVCVHWARIEAICHAVSKALAASHFGHSTIEEKMRSTEGYIGRSKDESILPGKTWLWSIVSDYLSRPRLRFSGTQAQSVLHGSMNAHSARYRTFSRFGIQECNQGRSRLKYVTFCLRLLTVT